MIWYLYISIALPHALTLVWNMYHQWHPFPSKEIGKREYFPEPPSVPSSYSCTSLPEYSLTGLASFFHPALTSWFLIYNTGTHTHTHTRVCVHTPGIKSPPILMRVAICYTLFHLIIFCIWKQWSCLLVEDCSFKGTGLERDQVSSLQTGMSQTKKEKLKTKVGIRNFVTE